MDILIESITSVNFEVCPGHTLKVRVWRQENLYRDAIAHKTQWEIFRKILELYDIPYPPFDQLSHFAKGILEMDRVNAVEVKSSENESLGVVIYKDWP